MKTYLQAFIWILWLGYGVGYPVVGELSLTNLNYFGSLDPGFFDSRPVTPALRNRAAVKKILLPSNNFIDVHYEAFSGFPNMNYLDISNNIFKFIAFEADKLQYLDASDNQIDDGEFTSFPALRALNLAGNRLVEVDWKFGDSPITEIDLSYNQHLRTVIIESENLQSLLLVNAVVEMLKLDAPMLELLDLRSAKIQTKNQEFEAICLMNVNQKFKIMYLDENQVETNFECNSLDAIEAKPDSLLIEKLPLPSANPSQPRSRRHDTKTNFNCDLSTFKITVDDVVLTQNDYFLMEISFYLLFTLIIVLSIGNFTLAYMYLSKSKTQSK